MAGKDNLKPFKKGKDPRRNTKGRPPIVPELKDALSKILAEEKAGKTKLERILNTMVDMADKGDSFAIRETLDRFYGKAQQKIEQTNINKEPMQIIVNNKKTAEKLKQIK